jgi:magnesium transporter
MPRTRLYRNGVLEHDDVPWSDALALLHDTTALLWIDYVAPTPAELEEIGATLSLHPLAIEDALHPHQRPKLDRYDTHEFLAAYLLLTRDGADDAAKVASLRRYEIDAFITERALVTVRPNEDFSMAAVLERWDGHPDLASCGVNFLLWGLLDVVIDSHFDTVQLLDEAIERLEDDVLDPAPDIRAIQENSYRLRKNLVLLRRLTLPMRDVVSSLLRSSLDAGGSRLLPYYQDLYDHVLRVTDWAESLRDLVSTVIDTNITNQSNRMNLVMKKVTSWAAIIAVPTLVTGFFGQNVVFPLLNTVAGFWVSCVIMLVSASILYAQFRRLDWL